MLDRQCRHVLGFSQRFSQQVVAEILVSIHAGSDLHHIGAPEHVKYIQVCNMVMSFFFSAIIQDIRSIVINRQQPQRWHHSGFVLLGRSLVKKTQIEKGGVPLSTMWSNAIQNRWVFMHSRLFVSGQSIPSPLYPLLQRRLPTRFHGPGFQRPRGSRPDPSGKGSPAPGLVCPYPPQK